MKTIKFLLKAFGCMVILLISLSSCSTTKKAAINCPILPRDNYKKVALHPSKHQKKSFIADHKIRTPKHYGNYLVRGSSADIVKNSFYSKSFPNLAVPKSLIIKNIPSLSKNEFNQNLITSTDNRLILLKKKENIVLLPTEVVMNLKHNDKNKPVSCDTIILKTGEKIITHFVNTTAFKVVYIRCESPKEKKLISIAKSEVLKIKYQNGGTDEIAKNLANANKKPIASIIGLILVVGALFLPLIPALLVVTAGLILAAIPMVNIDSYKRKKFVIVAAGIAIVLWAIMMAIVGFPTMPT